MLQVGGNEKGSYLERLTSLYFEQQRKAGADLTAILQQAEDFQREVEQEIDGAINNKNMEELAAISQGKFEVLDMSVSAVPEEKKQEAVDKAKDSLEEREEEREPSDKSSGGFTMEEIPVEKLKEALKGSDGTERDDE